VRRVAGAVDVQDDMRGATVALAGAQVEPSRAWAKARQAWRPTAFSKRESVGWLARSASLSGRRPQTSLSKGSTRKVSASFWSS